MDDDDRCINFVFLLIVCGKFDRTDCRNDGRDYRLFGYNADADTAFDALRPHLFTSYLDLWSRVFAEPVDWEKIRTGALYLGGYSFASVAVAWYIFVRKDILS